MKKKKDGFIVTVYAITKNEAKFVDKWFNSMKNADHIVVMDTGSTDDTVEKFKELASLYDNIKIYEKKIVPWHFGNARQACLELCPKDTDIFVSTDLDEYFEEENWVEILKSKWDKKYERGIYKYSWSHNDDGSSARVFRYDKIHNKDWVWKYPVHELMISKKRKDNSYPSDVCCYLFDDIHLHHFPDKNKSRSSYLPLLEQRAKEDPNDYYGLIYLAHERSYRKKYNEAIDTFRDILKRFNDRMSSVERASCYLFMGDNYTELGKLTEDENKKKDNFTMAEASYFQSYLSDPTYREGYIGLGKLYVTMKEYDKAIFYVTEGLKHGVRHYTWLERDHSWSYEPYDVLSLAYFYSGRKALSLSYAVKAASYDNNNERLKNNIKLILDNTPDEDYIPK